MVSENCCPFKRYRCSSTVGALCKPAFSRAMVSDWKSKATDLCCCTCINIDHALSKTSSVSRTYWMRHCQSVVWDWKNNGLEDIQTTLHYSLLHDPGHKTLSDETLANAEEYICRLYSDYETDTKINDVRFKLFNKCSKDYEVTSDPVFAATTHQAGTPPVCCLAFISGCTARHPIHCW